MFEWEGEELANIIWGKTGENEDHIVPYSDETYEIPKEPYEEDRKVSPSIATKLDLEHTDEKAQVDSGFVDCDWANVGSFDDLDRILSNNDLVYENANSLSMESPSLHVETNNKSRFIKDVNTNLELELMECSGGKNGKIYRFSQSASSNNARRISPLVYPNAAFNVAMPDENGIGIGIGIGIGKMGTKGKEFERGYTQTQTQTQHIKKSSSMKMARNQETEYKKSPCGYNNIMGNHEQFQSGSSSLMMMPLSMMMMMTPQQKIEKLRKRQKMRALLAINKQQQQEFRQISDFTSCSNESQIDDESVSTLVMNTSSLEDAILHQLESVISKLDIQIRLSIRDSLFRLAQNALQRKYAVDTLSSNEQHNLVTQERLGKTKSSARKPEGETKTNPIDRVVAHLLFHRPPELSGEHMHPQG